MIFWERNLILKVFKKIFLLILSLLLVLVLSLVLFITIALIQEKAFVTQEYMMWVFKSPVSRLVLIFEVYFVFLFFKEFRTGAIAFAKKHKVWVYPSFLFMNSLLLYTVIFNVSVVTNNKIIDHSFFKPTGKVYNYSEIVSIDTGVYGNRSFNPFLNNEGQFYYVLTLKDATKIDLNGDAGGTQNHRDIYEVFEELDRTFVDMGIKKTASMDSFELVEQDLDPIYVQRLKRILTNVN